MNVTNYLEWFISHYVVVLYMVKIIHIIHTAGIMLCNNLATIYKIQI